MITISTFHILFPMRWMVILFFSLTFVQAGELHQEALTCNVDHMRKLISQHPALNQLDENGKTPLHIAVESRKRACVNLLLEAGVDRSIRDRQGKTALDIASRLEDSSDRFFFTHMLKNFHQKNALTSQPANDSMPWTLEYSVMRGQIEATKMLLRMKADPNAIGKRGTTPLADAALKGDVESLRILLEYGARPAFVSQAGTQPIHDAALGDNPEVIRELVAKGADINARTRDEGQTPLHIAATMGKMKSVETLVALGANQTIKDVKQLTPMEAAEKVGLTDVVTYLKRPTLVQ